MSQKATKKTLRLLLSSKTSIYNKYAGKHVFVIQDKVIPFKKGKNSIKDFKSLEKKYGQKPVLMFVPKKGVSYILLLCLS